MEFRIADTFTDSLARLTGDEQRAVKTTAFDLQLNPANPGMSLHRLDRARDRNFWSLRVSSDIRLIVHKSDASFLLCYVDHHDRAYDWAERRKLETHPKTGAAQWVEIRETVHWCEAYLPTAQAQVDDGLRRLVRHTLFEGQETERLVRQAGVEMELAFDEWQAEWQALIEQESGLGPGAAIDPAARAIGFQKKRLAEEYLLRELATQGFLPGYGFPTSIASFDNTTVTAARRLPPPDGPATRGRDDNRFQKRDLASRDLVTALREYAPGAELVMDGLVYRSAGITLNWHIPADQEGARETQAIKFAWRCRSCGASGTTMSLKLASNCDACGARVHANDIQQFLEPAGFSVDFYEEPHNDVTRQQFVPVERPWISARGDWSPLPNPALGRFRVTTDCSSRQRGDPRVQPRFRRLA